VAVDASPHVPQLTPDIAHSIANPNELAQITARANNFIYTHHHYLRVAEQYVALWNQHG